MKPQQIFENNKKWIAEKLAIDDKYFEKLSEGQSPELLYIGCSDSRVETFTDCTKRNSIQL